MTELAWALRERVAELIRRRGDFFSLTAALSNLLFGTAMTACCGHPAAVDGRALARAYDRSMWLLESLGQTGGRDSRGDTTACLPLRESSSAARMLNRTGPTWSTCCRGCGGDRRQGTVVRGAAIGGAVVAGGDGTARRSAGKLRHFAKPRPARGDFLQAGCRMAREQVQRQRDLILAITTRWPGWSEEEFCRR